MHLLDGKVALITGGGTGIGAATAARFRAEGAEVVITGRRRGVLDRVAADTGALAVPGDMAARDDARAAVQTAVDRFRGLDVLVANAGGGGGGAVLDTDDGKWAEGIQLNLTTAFVAVREALPALLERGGAIVIVSSLAGLFAGPAMAGYVTAKHALIGLTRSLARDYGPRGVRVNAVCPGWVRTPIGDEQMDILARRKGITREEAYELAASRVPLRRAGHPEEIASIVAFLASGESSMMTGSILVADGGAATVDMPTLEFEPD